MKNENLSLVLKLKCWEGGWEGTEDQSATS